MATKTANLIKRYHMLIRKAEIGDTERRRLLARYGVTSSKSMTDDELLELCEILESKRSEKNDAMNVWRKRVIAAACSYFDNMNIKYNSPAEKIDKAKGLACRSTHFESFNDIPRARLITIYNGLVRMNNDLKRMYHEMGEMANE